MRERRAFEGEQRRQLKAFIAARRRHAEEVVNILTVAKGRIRDAVAGGMLSDYSVSHMQALNASIDAVMIDISDALGVNANEGIATAHTQGIDLVDAPLEKISIELKALMPDVDVRQMLAVQAFASDRLKGVSRTIGQKIKGHVSTAMLGGQTPTDAVTHIAGMIEGGRARAITIMRTEMGRAYSMATQARLSAANAGGVPVKKQWRRSGKLHSRPEHDIIDGQIVEADEAFIVNGHKLRYPRDPSAPAAETINCGCVALPYMDDWDMKQPARQAFSPHEKYNNPLKQRMARALDEPLADSPGRRRIMALENMPAEDARRAIADTVRSPEFVQFASNPAPPDEHMAVAVLPNAIKERLGTKTAIVRLSGDTVAKQIVHRRGQTFRAEDYALVQTILDSGTLTPSRDRKYSLLVTGKSDNQTWRAVVKATANEEEAYLASFHKVTP